MEVKLRLKKHLTIVDCVCTFMRDVKQFSGVFVERFKFQWEGEERFQVIPGVSFSQKIIREKTTNETSWR